MSENEKWAFSLDGEEYYGEYDSPDEALEAAKEETDSDNRLLHVAKIQFARDLLPDTLDVVDGILERADELLTECIVSDDVIVELDEEKTEELENSIVDFLRNHARFNRWSIDDTTVQTFRYFRFQ